MYYFDIYILVGQRYLYMSYILIESGDRVLESVSTAANVLQRVSGGLGCTLYLYNEHNVCMTHSDRVENCRQYVVK